MDGKQNRLGRGLDALIPKRVDDANDNSTPVQEVEEKNTEQKGAKAKPQKKEDVDEKALELAIQEGADNPRVVVWSPMCSILLRYLKKTTPEFSISKEVASVLEEALKNKYPELWGVIEKEMMAK